MTPKEHGLLLGLEHWAAGAAQFPQVHWEYTLFLFTLTWELRPALVYEVGVRHGNSTRAILNGLRHGGGRLISCDVNNCEAVVRSPDLRARWEFRHMPSSEFAAQLTEQADMVYIDGGHSFGSVSQDVMAFWPLLRTDGLIVLDDTASHPDGPGKVIRLLKSGGIEALSLSAYANGFGLIQKREGDAESLLVILRQ